MEVVAEKRGSSYVMVLYIDGNEAFVVNDNDLGWAIYETKLARVSSEITIVPKEGKYSNFNNVSGGQQSFIKYAEVTGMYAVTGHDELYVRASTTMRVNCDDSWIVNPFQDTFLSDINILYSTGVR